MGKSYFDAQLSFSESSVIGLVKADQVHINPAPDVLVDAHDQLILIAEDDSTIKLTTPGAVDAAAIAEPVKLVATPEKTLVLGYNSGLTSMLRELSEYVAPKSSVTVVADVDDPQLDSYDNMPVTFTRGDSTSRKVLNTLAVDSFDHIIVLAYSDSLDAQRADAKTLITLLHLRELGDAAGADLNVVSEMLDDRNRELAEVTNADDFIVSDRLIALMLSQVSENKKLSEVFATLFSSEGSEIYLRPAELYVREGSSVDFYTILEAARRRGETAIGYRIAAVAHNSQDNYGVTVNPRKGAPKSFVTGDKIIVLADS